MTLVLVTIGLAWMLPRTPCVWPAGPAVKKIGILVAAVAAVTHEKAQRPGIMMFLPLASCNGPSDAPVFGSKALMAPSPKFPTNKSLANFPNVAGAMATPHGEFSGPLAMRCWSSFPVGS